MRVRTINVVAIVAAAAWWAQAAPARAKDASHPPDAETAAPEVTVTARRREERLSTTPVAATILSGDELARATVRGLGDLRGRVSNLELVPLLSGGTSVTIRGVGQTADQVNSDTKAGLYVDGLYLSRLEGDDLYFFDLASVQVLKGPQGTLFGKNTTAGALLVTTRRPSDVAGGYAQLRLGSFRRVELEAAADLALAAGVTVRVSGRARRADGFIRHTLDRGRSGDVNDAAVRVQARAERGPATIDLLAELHRSHTDGGATIALACLPGADYIANYDSLHRVPYCSAFPPLARRDAVYGGATLLAPTSAAVTDVARGGDAGLLARHAGRTPFNDSAATTLNGRVALDLGGALTLRSATGYRRSHARFYTPVLDAPDDIYAEYDDTSTSQVTEELTLSGGAPGARLGYVGGIFYFDQATRFLQDTGPDWIDPLGYVYDATLRYRSYAAFAQAWLRLTPQLELTAGARLTRDRKRATSWVFFAGRDAAYLRDGVPRRCGYFTGDFLGGVARCGGAPFTASGARIWHGADPKLQLSYRWSDALFTYVSAAHGYNAGGFNQQLGAPAPGGRFASAYDPETLWSYEAGSKLDLLAHRLRLDVAAFYQRYADIQAGVNVLIGAVSTRQVQSAATAYEAGFEADLALRPLPGLDLSASVSRLAQAYDSIRPGAVALTLRTPVSSAPRYTYGGAISYEARLAGGGTLTPSIDLRGTGAKPACQSGADYVCRLPATALLGARIDFAPSAGSAWRIGVAATNLLDARVQLARTGFLGGFGIDRFTPGRPREIALELARHL